MHLFTIKDIVDLLIIIAFLLLQLKQNYFINFFYQKMQDIITLLIVFKQII